MYIVQLDENNFFTGTYAKVGAVPGGITVESLPPSENYLCYKLVDKEVTEEVREPVTVYERAVVDENNVVTTYISQAYDENGELMNSTSITEDEYNNLSDEEKENVIISSYPTIETIELSKEEYDALSDDEKGEVTISYKTDDNGNLVYETREIKKTIKVWEFSQVRYDELEESKNNQDSSSTELSMMEEINTLKEDNENLKEQVSTLDSTLTALIEDILPSITE